MVGGEDLRRPTRRQLLIGAGGGAAALAVGGAALAAERLLTGGAHKQAAGSAAAHASEARRFHSRPDLHPPDIDIAGRSAEPGYVFLGPGTLGATQGGPLIVGADGAVLWFKPLRSPMWETNFTAASYQGQPVLAWWEGEVLVPIGYGQGEGVIVDDSYSEIGRVRAANGRRVDMHEFRLTPEGTALFTCYPEIRQADLSEIGGSRDGRVVESIIQEIDLQSGRLVMEWRSLEHIPVSESYRPPHDPYDYLHANSIDVAADGNLLVSGRHTWTIYKLDRRTGEVIWRLGGKRSDYSLTRDARFTWQHDARRVDDRTITVFDNGFDGKTKSESQSRGVVLDVDSTRRTVRLRRAYLHPEALLADAMGSVEVLPDGHILVGWGSKPYATEFTADGELVADVRLPRGLQSYRAFRLPWTGVPANRPAIAARPDPVVGATTLYASWNGATDVAHWQVHAGPSPRRLHRAGVVHRQGFETAIPLDGEHRYAEVTALDASAQRLAKSRTIRL